MFDLFQLGKYLDSDWIIIVDENMMYFSLSLSRRFSSHDMLISRENDGSILI